MESLVIQLSDGHIMPAIGYGTYPLKGEAAETAVLHALAAGYRMIDTATKYANEDAIGRAIKKSGVDRSEIFLTTKVTGEDYGRDKTKKALDASLRALQTDYVDLYLLHQPHPDRQLLLETWWTLLELQRAGKVRSVGVSNLNADDIDFLVEQTGEVPVVNQIEVHPDRPAEHLCDYLTMNGIVAQAWSPLGLGFSKKIGTSQASGMSSDVVSQIANSHQRSNAQVVLRWHLQRGLSVIPHSTNARHMADNLNVMDITLSPSQLGAIDNIGKRVDLTSDVSLN